MKKILHIIRNVGNGGTEKFLMSLLNNTYKDHENYILTYDKVTYWQKELEEMNVHIIQGKSPKKTGVFSNIKTIKSIIKKEKIDIVYAYTYYNSGYAMLAAFLSGAKIRITHAHRSTSEKKKTFKYNMYIFISKLLINFFSTDRLACGKEAGDSLFYKSKKYEIINNGINIEKYIFNEQIRKRIRDKFKINDNTIIIGTIGRLDENKNHIFLINLIKKLNDNTVLMIIGEGNKKEELQKSIKTLKCEKKVLLLGNKDNANEYYNAFDIFVLPSIKEGLPFVLIEAQTNGLKCIVSDSVDRAANITQNIEFINLDNKKEWINKLNKKEERQNNIKSIIDNGYSINDCVKKITNIYEKK